MTDYISRADAIDAVAEEWLSEASAESPYVNDDDIDRYRELAEELFADIPSADAVPTVIRAKTFMLKEDFDKWAEDIKRQNKSIVCIPCDAEVVSANAVQGEWKQEYRKTANGVDFCVIACSECDYYDAQMHYYNYCPSCGTRMKGGAE